MGRSAMCRAGRGLTTTFTQTDEQNVKYVVVHGPPCLGSFGDGSTTGPWPTSNTPSGSVDPPASSRSISDRSRCRNGGSERPPKPPLLALHSSGSCPSPSPSLLGGGPSTSRQRRRCPWSSSAGPTSSP